MKSKILATLALLAISILPGCGKSNNSGVAVSGVYGGGYYNNYGTYNGQAMGCYNLSSYLQSNPNGGFQATFAGIGAISQNTGAVAGEMYGSQTLFTTAAASSAASSLTRPPRATSSP
ncbi:MAG: hypothetical protein EOP11_13750 [Proteobacteria bacterium]|nr:MAG: hypothetical protein EOP11_13750 [Pseudomonadota bacterium]